MVSRFAIALAVALGLTSSAGVLAESPPASPLSPEQALAEFRLPEGLKIELVASEPQVHDPVAIRFDELGRMWVVDMGDYPHGPADGEQPKSQIRILEDHDGDGQYESSIVFADGLLFATGVQPWKDGAFVTMAGQIAYFRDADGDGKAESSETWYAGFAQENSQLRANHPRFHWDGNIYVANGLRGGSVFDPSRPRMSAVSISGMDFRFSPLSRDFEAVTGDGQFGMAFDDAGNRFTCSNRNPLRLTAIEDRYLKRSPLALVPATVHDVAAAGEASRVYPLSRAWTTSNLHAGQFTAACGVNIYRGDALPAEFRGDGFTCDPTGNLVHRERIAADGALLAAKPAYEGVEFLASRDEWFRPVNVENGPDGALYIVDMYRAVIEHPDWMPEELKTRPDLRLGDDRGRIWRVTSAESERSKFASLAGASLEKLAADLGSPNGWRRDTAARLLIASQDRGAAEALARAAIESPEPGGRSAALHILQGLGALSDETLERSLADFAADVRKQAVVLAESRLQGAPAWREKIARIAAEDADARVRFQATLTLSPADQDEIEALAKAALHGVDDVWMRRAIAIAANQRAGELVAKLATLSDFKSLANSSGLLALLVDLGGQVGRSNLPEQRQAFIGAVAPLAEQPALQLAALEIVLLTASRHGAAPDAVLAELSPEVRSAVDAAFTRAAALAADSNADEELRVAAVSLLVLSPAAADTIRRLALEETNQAIRKRAIAMLARSSDAAPWRELIDRFPGESPAIRVEILDGALAATDRTEILVEAMVHGRMRPGEIDAARADRLLKHPQESIRATAAELFGSLTPADRQKVLADYQPCLSLAADAARGRQIFAKNCANCHRIGELGVNVAPDISDSRVKTAEQILGDILQPNRAIDSNYVSFTVTTTDGRTLTGVLSQETATSITLKQQEGKTVTLARGEIEEMRSNGVSLMPEGLEKDIPAQDMADLVAFIKNWRYLDGLTPLGAKN